MKSVYRMGAREVHFPSEYLGELTDSTHLHDDAAGLRARLADDGYVLVRGVIAPSRIEAARRTLLEGLRERGHLDSTAPLDQAIARLGARGAFFRDEGSIARSPGLLSAVEAPELFEFFQRLFGGPVATTTHKWIRATAPGGFTGAHMDVVYMGRGTHELVTSWIPFGSVTRSMGALAVLPGSHRLPSFAKIRATYGKMDVDRDNVGGWFSNDPIELVDLGGIPWRTTDFAPGDVLVFTLLSLHMSLTNASNRFRLTADVRWQPADQAMDERWFGEQPRGHYAWMQTPPKDMAEARREWGV